MKLNLKEKIFNLLAQKFFGLNYNFSEAKDFNLNKELKNNGGNIPYKNIKGTIKSNKKAKTECLYSPWITLSSVNKIGLLKNLSIK